MIAASHLVIGGADQCTVEGAITPSPHRDNGKLVDSWWFGLRFAS